MARRKIVRPIVQTKVHNRDEFERAMERAKSGDVAVRVQLAEGVDFDQMKDGKS